MALRGEAVSLGRRAGVNAATEPGALNNCSMGLGRILGRKHTQAGTAHEEPARATESRLGALRERLRGELRDDALTGGLKLASDDADARTHADALILVAWRRFSEAAALFARLTQFPDVDDHVLVDAGWCFHALGRAQAALDCFARVLARSPSSTDALFGASSAQFSLKALAEAKDGFLRLLALAPGYPDAWLALGHVELALGNGAAAEAAARQAIDHFPASEEAWCLLARLQKMLGRDDEAFTTFAHARALGLATGDGSMTAGHLAVALVETGQQAKALALCEEVLTTTPNAFLSASYAIALLTVGRLREGWSQYESRWYRAPMLATRVRYDCPLWHGQPLVGKTIMLRSEQGIGDVVQFARYASLLKAQGARVLLHAHAGMGRLAAGFTDVDEVQEKIRLPIEFDYFINMMSLPRVFDTGLDGIPASVPYLAVDAALSKQWRTRIAGAGLRVGLVWAGNPRHLRDHDRSIPLACLAPLWGLPQVRFFSLQKDLRKADAPHVPDRRMLELLGPELTDLCDAAAAIEQLDLLISVDTALAHLAGALGKPVWLLLPSVADFRWLEDREDSPWYPTMRLVRQKRAGDWAEVVDRVRDMLCIASGDPSGLVPSPRIAPASRTVPAQPAPSSIPEFEETDAGILQVIPGLDQEARALQTFGEYLGHRLDVILDHIPMDAWIVEVGSGFGAHAIRLSRMLAPEAALLLYEGRHGVSRILRQNLEANGVADRVSLPRGRLLPNDDPNDGPLHSIDQLRLPRLDLLVLRVGDPGAILAGCDQTLWTSRPKVLVGDEHGAALADVVRIVREYSYRIWRLDSPVFRTNNFKGNPIAHGRQVVSSILCIPEEAEAGAVDRLEEIR
ncbi:MAG: tetratricopeptide repeat protein [Burkholderiales bacterium]|nr:tetratricopeptide repeat protein [Burkholderiales bacterium]